MANILNIGALAIYKKNISGDYEYTYLYDLLDYLNEDGSINIDNNINFGASFDMIGDHLFVGCPYQSPLVDDENIWQNNKLGVVYVFDITDGTLIQTIIPDNTPGEFTFAGQTNYVTRSHNFGYSMAAGDDYIVIGAPGYSTNSGASILKKSGRAYVYKHNGSEYELVYTFAPNTVIKGNRFGNYIDVDGDNVVIGSAPSANASLAGYVKFYTMNTARTGISVNVTISNTHVSTVASIKVNGDKVAIGTYYNDTIKIHKIDSTISSLIYSIRDDLTAGFGVGRDIEFDDTHVIAGCPTGYRKLGIVLRFTNLGQTYTLT